MRIAYLDCFSGISGDMFLGALLDAGVSPALLEKTVAALDVGARLEIGRVVRGGISATKVDVVVAGEKDAPRKAKNKAHDHGHEHGHHHHEHSHDHAHDHAHEHGRGLKEIRQIIQRPAISAGAKKTAIAIFEALGKAEAEIHNTDIEKIHFHEVGAADALVDIVGAAVGAEALGLEEWVCSPLNVGGGTVECAHGTFPVPAPATLKLLAGAPVYSSGVEAELVTPTGAAIVHVLAARFAPFPAMKLEKTGYGAGARELHGQPNVVRLTVGEAQAARAEAASDLVAVLEANLDDLNPQVFGYVMERALAEGALDVFGAPVQMKKNRPGMLLTVLCRPEDADGLAKLLFTETTTLGVRRREEQRQVLRRESVSVATPWGEVRMKVAHLNGSVANFAPEYEDCRRIAGEHHLPLKTVMQEASRLYLERKHG
ncbi:MAG TPA: nickel pincer cofactor biosynthesis protein LarC [Terriglobales bacterium]|nr:nickel pincer cofactor biosynthesis protein LarC [Terriglobales bacterium]